jgi:hypothetical protein
MYYEVFPVFEKSNNIPNKKTAGITGVPAGVQRI